MSFTSTALYYGSLTITIALGSHYKKIMNLEIKRKYGTGLGMFIALLICGYHIYHSVLMIWGNMMILKYCNRSKLHQFSLGFTWLYLTFLHYKITDKYIIWLYQTLALRLVGMVFEIYSNEKFEQRPISTARLNMGEFDTLTTEPTWANIIAYSYFFIGLHKGPYYRMKIFEDHFAVPFGAIGDCWEITEQKLKKASICGIAYWVIRMKYSKELYEDPKFYSVYGADFRFLYNIPLILMYLLEHEAIMMLCTSVFTEAGFGIYPAKCEAIPGHGPTARHSLLRVTSLVPQAVFQEEHNFSMLKCFRIDRLFIGPKMKDTLKGWDLPTRYFFWAYIYKRVLKSSKDVRRGFSFLAWTAWRGLTLPNAFLSITLWIYVHIETEYTLLYNTTGTMKLPWDIGFSIMRLFCLLYLTPCLVSQKTEIVFLYYNSIFWVYHLILFILMIIVIIINKSRNM